MQAPAMNASRAAISRLDDARRIKRGHRLVGVPLADARALALPVHRHRAGHCSAMVEPADLGVAHPEYAREQLVGVLPERRRALWRAPLDVRERER